MFSRSVLRHRGFLAVWLAQAISRIGDSIHEIALIWLTYEVTGDPGLLSVVAAASLLPTTVFSLPAGTVADRVNRKYLLVVSDAIRGLTVLAIPMAADSEFLVPVVVVVAFLTGLMQAFFGPARNAIIPNVVPEAELDAANALSGMTQSVSRTLYVLGGLVVGVFGSFAAFYLDAATFVISAVVLLAVPTEAGEPDGSREAATAPAIQQMIADVRDGLAYVRSHAVIPIVVAMMAVMNFTVGPLSIVIPVFVEEFLGLGSLAFGFVFSAFFVGIFLASVALNAAADHVVKHRGAVIVGGLLTGGVTLAAAAVIPHRTPFPLAASVGVFVLFGTAFGCVQIPATTLTQALVVDDMRGKVSSVMQTAGQVAPLAGIALAGLLLKAIEPTTLFIAYGATIATFGVVVRFTPLGSGAGGSPTKSDTTGS